MKVFLFFLSALTINTCLTEKKDSIEIQKNTQIDSEQKIVIVDDLVATGGTAIACAELFTDNFNIKHSNILILSVINLEDLGGRKLILNKGFAIQTIIDY